VVGVTVVGIRGEGDDSNGFYLGDLLVGYAWSKGRLDGCG
jgi:hypothetical protein